MIINFSNHPSAKWSKKQKEAAEKYGKIVDISFPAISSLWTEKEVSKLADEYCKKIRSTSAEYVMCQGEFTFTYAMIIRLKKHGIKILAACNERMTDEKVAEDGTAYKTTIFNFVKFREYV